MDYSGMTVNERLFEAGLLDKFTEAAHKRDRELLISILKEVKLEQKQAEETVSTLLKDPKFYGY